MPQEFEVKEQIQALASGQEDKVDIAISLCLYYMTTQVFNDGNKRAFVIFANHYLIGQGQGLIVIPESDVSEFRTLLVAYYEGRDEVNIREFMRDRCWRKFWFREFFL